MLVEGLLKKREGKEKEKRKGEKRGKRGEKRGGGEGWATVQPVTTPLDECGVVRTVFLLSFR